MKISLLVLIAIAALVRGDDDSMKSFKQCLDENDIKGNIDVLKERDNPKLRCIMACVMEKEGILTNGEVKKDKLKKDLLEDAEQLGEEKVSEIVDYCLNLAKELTDVCDKTNLIGICIKEEFAKYNIKFDK